MDLSHLQSMKEQILEDVKLDTKLSNLEKLEIIWDNQLLKVGPWLQHPFTKYEKELKEEAKVTNPDPHGFYMTDCMITRRVGDGYFDRNQTLSFHDLANMIYDYAEDDKIAVAFLRAPGGTGEYAKEKVIPVEEAVECLFNFAIENKMSGFTIDW